jgi:hypothetical protein
VSREPFWTATPASPSDEDQDGEECDSDGQPAVTPTVLQGIRLDDEVTLLLASARPVDDDDLLAIRTVAAPLLKLLKTRRLLGPSTQKETS